MVSNCDSPPLKTFNLSQPLSEWEREAEGGRQTVLLREATGERIREVDRQTEKKDISKDQYHPTRVIDSPIKKRYCSFCSHHTPYLLPFCKKYKEHSPELPTHQHLPQLKWSQLKIIWIIIRNNNVFLNEVLSILKVTEIFHLQPGL